MEHTHRTSILFALLFTTTASFPCDADVLRLNYRKAPAAKPAPKPATTIPKSTDALHKKLASAASLTASTKLEPR